MRPRVPMQHDRAGSGTPPRRLHPTAGSPGGSVERIVALQRAAGNAAVLRLLAEARHVHGAGCGHQPQPSAPVQRSSVPDVLRSPGRPLDGTVRGDMEARLGADFSDVRLHTGIAAERSATEIGARAYTAGSHIVIGAGGADRTTLAHELTHVIQQRQGPVAGTDDGTGLRISDPSDRFEREAEANAARAMRSGAVGADGARPAATEPPRQGASRGPCSGLRTRPVAEVAVALPQCSRRASA
jgi:hypothetical protein